MALGPLPANNTSRVFIDYTAGGQKHTAEIRLPSGSSQATAETAAAHMAPLMAPFLWNTDSVYGARFQLAGSNVSFPISFTPVAGLQTPTDPDRKPNFISFTGRSLDGRRVRFTLFTPAEDIDAVGYRDTTPSSYALAILNGLKHANVNARSISGANPYWNSYVNSGVNAYYQRKMRRTQS